jgi:hypothetical protein
MTGSRINLVAIVLFALFFLSCKETEEQRKQAAQLQKIAAETPLYPRFQKTAEKIVYKNTIVYFNVYYKSDARFSEVKEFYDQALAARGWGPPQQSGPSLFRDTNANWVAYKRPDYEITVAQGEHDPTNFDVVYKWDPQQR